MTHNILDRIKELDITEINAGYRVFKLEFAARINVGGDDCQGAVDFDLGIIKVSSKLDNEAAKEALVHELTHVALELVGLGGGEDDAEPVIAKSNEYLTLSVSRGWLLLMNLNPELFTLIVENPPSA